jgi:hypothetical protein
MGWKKIVDRKLNQSYRGSAEKATYQISAPPDQFIPDPEDFVLAHVESLAEENSILLEVKAWWNTDQTFTTDFWIEVTASASPLFWSVIILAAMAILGIWIIAQILHSVEHIAEYIGPGGFTLLALGGIATVVFAGIYLVRRKT